MLRNAFDCNLLLVNLQDIFSNADYEACRRGGSGLVWEQDISLTINCAPCLSDLKHCTELFLTAAIVIITSGLAASKCAP